MTRQTLVVLFLALLLASAVSVYAAEADPPAQPAAPLTMGTAFSNAPPLAEGTYKVKTNAKSDWGEVWHYLKFDGRPGYLLNVDVTAQFPDKCSAAYLCETDHYLYLYNADQEHVSSLADSAAFKVGKPFPTLNGWYFFSAEQAGSYYLVLKTRHYYGPPSKSTDKDAEFEADLAITWQLGGDAGSTTDAPTGFTQALPLTPGTHKAYLLMGRHGVDKIDTYSIDLKKFEKLSIRIVPDEKYKGSFGVSFYNSDRQKFAFGHATAANAGAIVNASLAAAPVGQTVYFQILNADPIDNLLGGTPGGPYSIEVKVEPAESCTSEENSMRGSCTGQWEACIEGKCVSNSYYYDYVKKKAPVVQKTPNLPTTPKTPSPSTPKQSPPAVPAQGDAMPAFFEALYRFLSGWFGGKG